MRINIFQCFLLLSAWYIWRKIALFICSGFPACLSECIFCGFCFGSVLRFKISFRLSDQFARDTNSRRCEAVCVGVCVGVGV